ncbi:glycosyltransferase family 2 protein [Shimia sp. R9_2]|uniref:glycosyltransferase family 2 protein n=1 Tax=Shimia sp. R9_2 TaxID=2821112 RepID=UPI001ADA85FC|nr:glycosyltransferase family 2 protein [Shimia sp. R9_2]MBO9398878.1 glycosyltransferase family 2 protein [Shimia sp. R9_2]
MVTTIDPARVAVLIPTLNEADQIEAVLSQIMHGDAVASRCTVIVADGGSSDDTCAIVTRLMSKHSNLHLRHNSQRIQAAAFNLLLSPEFDGIDFAIRCDAHAAYPQGYVSDLVHCMLEKEVDSVVVPMDAVADSNSCFQSGLAWVADTPLGAGGSPHRGGNVSGYCEHGHHAAFRMSTFRKLGGYDVDFRTNEDAEYDKRLSDFGGSIWLNSDVRIKYFPRKTASRLWRQYFRYGEGRARTCLKHSIKPAPRQMIPAVHTAVCAVSLAALPITSLLLLWPAFYALAMLSCGILIALRHRSICGLAASVALATMHFAWGIGFLSRLMKKSPRTFSPQPAE